MSTHGRPPKHNGALKAFLGGHLLRITKAAIASGSTNAKVSAALTILQNDDTVLTASVLQGRETLARTAGKVRGRVRLVEAFKTAASDDLAVLGRVIGLAARWSTPRACPPLSTGNPIHRTRPAPGARD